MIERADPKLTVGAHCRLLSISRSSFHYSPQGETAMNLDLMLLRDKQCCQTNANSSQFRWLRTTAGRKEITPLDESGGAGGIVVFAAGERSLVVEVVGDSGMDGSKLLKAPHPAEPQHGTLSSPEGEV